MGLKEFAAYYSATPAIRGELERTRAVLGLYQRHLLVVLARKIKDAGTDGLRRASSMIGDSAVAQRPTSEDFTLAPLEIKKILADHRAAVIFAVTIPVIQQILAFGEFDKEKWWDEYNSALVGSLFDNSKIERGMEKISEERLFAMRQAADRDRTLACFFENDKDFNLLPVGLRQILDASGILSVIKSAILPLYKERAKFLVE